MSYGYRRTIRRRKQREIVASNREDAFGTQDPGVAASGSEETATVRYALETLPDKLREAVELHHLQSLSLQETASVMKITVKAVESRVLRGRELLRRQLKKAGFVPAVVGLPELLARCVDFPETPDATFVLKTITRVERFKFVGSAVHSARAAAVFGKTGMLTAGAAMLSVIVAGGVWLHSSKSPAPDNDQTVAVFTPSNKPLNDHWDFTAGIPEGFIFYNGCYGWRPPEKGESGGLVLPPFNNTMVLLPAEIPPQPFVVEINVRFLVETSNWHCGMSWSDGEKQIPAAGGTKNVKIETAKDYYTFRYFFFKRHIIGFHNDVLAAILEYPRPYPGRRILMMSDNTMIKNISIRTINADELPADLRDPQKYAENSGFSLIPLSPIALNPSLSDQEPNRAETLKRRWTFENGVPEDLRLAAGDPLRQHPLGQNTVALKFAADQNVCLLLGDPIPREPFMPRLICPRNENAAVQGFRFSSGQIRSLPVQRRNGKTEAPRQPLHRTSGATDQA